MCDLRVSRTKKIKIGNLKIINILGIFKYNK